MKKLSLLFSLFCFIASNVHNSHAISKAQLLKLVGPSTQTIAGLIGTTVGAAGILLSTLIAIESKNNSSGYFAINPFPIVALGGYILSIPLSAFASYTTYKGIAKLSKTIKQ